MVHVTLKCEGEDMMKIKSKKRSLTSKRERAGWLFILPFVLGLLLIFLPSVIKTIAYSFNRIILQPGGYKLEFRGLAYYKNALFVHSTYNRTLVETVMNMALNVPLVLIFSFFMATLLNTKFRGRGLMQLIVFLPVITSSGVLAALNAANVTDGLLTAASSSDMAGMQMSSTWVLDALGLSGSVAAYFSTALSKLYEIITSSGIQILIFLAALKSIPDSVYEAAKMEGATGWESFWKVTFPMVSPYILTNVVYSIVNSLSSNTSSVLKLVLETARTGNIDLSLSSAMALMFCLVELAVLAVMAFIVSRVVFYYD